jgi:hypothetical protein
MLKDVVLLHFRSLNTESNGLKKDTKTAAVELQKQKTAQNWRTWCSVCKKNLKCGKNGPTR